MTLTSNIMCIPRYCCATDCNNGDVEISTSNGEVTCRCYHH